MKISISLPDEDGATLDNFVRERNLPSRSAAIQRAVRQLAHPRLEDDYAAAWRELGDGGDEQAWSAAVNYGLDGA